MNNIVFRPCNIIPDPNGYIRIVYSWFEYLFEKLKGILFKCEHLKSKTYNDDYIDYNNNLLKLNDIMITIKDLLTYYSDATVRIHKFDYINIECKSGHIDKFLKPTLIVFTRGYKNIFINNGNNNAKEVNNAYNTILNTREININNTRETSIYTSDSAELLVNSMVISDELYFVFGDIIRALIVVCQRYNILLTNFDIIMQLFLNIEICWFYLCNSITKPLPTLIK